MANRYWVGGTATWDGTAGTKWSTTSGGGGGSAVPTAADDVFFDGSSGSGTCTTSGSRVCRSLDCNGYTGAFHQASAITIGDGTAGAGNRALRFSAGMTYTHADKDISLASTSGTTQTVTVAGKSLYNLRLTGSGGSWQLTDALTLTSNSTAFNKTNGTLDSNSQSITCTGSNLTFAGGGSTFADVTFSGTGTVTITGTNTFSRLIATGSAKTFTLPGGVTTTFTGSTPFPTGTAGNVMTFVSSSGSATVSFSNSVSVDYVALTDIVASGTTPAYSGLNSTDGGGNTSWVFSLPPKIFTTPGSLSWRPADDGYPTGDVLVECWGGGGNGAATMGGGGGGGGGEYRAKTISLTDTTTYSGNVSVNGAGNSSYFQDGVGGDRDVEAMSGSDASTGTGGAGGTGGTGTTGYAGGAGGAGGSMMGDGGGGGGGAAGDGGAGSAGTNSSGSGTHAGGANGTDTTGQAGDGGQGGGGTGGGSSAVGGNYGGGGGGGGMMGGASNGAGGCVRFSWSSGGVEGLEYDGQSSFDGGFADITGI